MGNPTPSVFPPEKEKEEPARLAGSSGLSRSKLLGADAGARIRTCPYPMNHRTKSASPVWIRPLTRGRGAAGWARPSGLQ